MNGAEFAFFRCVALNWPRLAEAGWAELIGDDQLLALLMEDWRSGAR